MGSSVSAVKCNCQNNQLSKLVLLHSFNFRLYIRCWYERFLSLYVSHLKNSILFIVLVNSGSISLIIIEFQLFEVSDPRHFFGKIKDGQLRTFLLDLVPAILILQGHMTPLYSSCKLWGNSIFKTVGFVKWEIGTL